MSHFKPLAFAALLLSGWVGTADAAVIEFSSLAGATASPPGLTFDLGDGLSVTVTGHTHSGGADADAPFTVIGDRDLHQGFEGLGVIGGLDENPKLSADDANELLRFTFSSKVNLLSVIFDDTDNTSDEFDMSVDGVDIDVVGLLGGDNIRFLPDTQFGVDSGLADFTDHAVIGTIFDFYTDDALDDYRIRQVAVEAVAAVPAPATLTLLGIGLAGLGIARRRRSD